MKIGKSIYYKIRIPGENFLLKNKPIFWRKVFPFFFNHTNLISILSSSIGNDRDNL